MPKKRQDLNSTIVVTKANWTSEKIVIQLDNKAKKKKNEYNRLKSEFIKNGNRFTKNRHRDIQARIEKEYT